MIRIFARYESTILFSVQPPQQKAGGYRKSPLHVEVYFSRTVRRWVPTHVEVEPRFWNAKAKVVKKEHPNYIGLYQMLKQQVDELEKFELSLINQGRALTPLLLDAYLKGSKDSFIDFSHAHIEEQLAQRRIKDRTYKGYRSQLALIEVLGGNDLLFSEVNDSLPRRLDSYLATHGYAPSTVRRLHLTVMKFVKEATKKGHLDPKKNPYEAYTLSKGKSERENLHPEELSRLENMDRQLLDSPRLEQVLDRFLYSCYTGLRIGDNILLSKEHVKKTADGLVVDMVTEKGEGQHIVHHLAYLFEGKPQAIIEKYLSLYPHQRSIFPLETPSMLDYYIKIVAKKAGLERNIYFHLARHTCGTMLADITANPYLIMDIMGHADIKTSMIYIHRSSERVKKQLKNLNWRW